MSWTFRFQAEHTCCSGLHSMDYNVWNHLDCVFSHVSVAKDRTAGIASALAVGVFGGSVLATWRSQVPDGGPTIHEVTEILSLSN